DGVTVDIASNNLITVKGPKGELQQKVNPEITVKQQEKELIVARPTEQKRHKSLHGLYRMLISNMVIGVSEGYTRKLELVGVGYRVSVTGQVMEFTLGYSHPIIFKLPKEVTATVVAERRQNPVITLESHDKQLIGQVAAKIRSMRKPEPYKGKGIRYVGEYVRRKAGKTAATA
ncbi:MAG: 50S ribosomal protein L6, partial [Bacteroidetes bacterium]|nr:50S ribosomal protein L6 [Bacteroidota bacterium]